jgi:hypothetical protein
LPERGRVAVPAKPRADPDRKALSVTLDIAKALLEGKEDRARRIALAYLGNQLKKEVGDGWSWLVDELVGRLPGSAKGVGGPLVATSKQRITRRRSGKGAGSKGGGDVAEALRGLLRLLESDRS